MIVFRTLRVEAYDLLRHLRTPWLWLLLGVFAIGGALIYRQPFAYDLRIGGVPSRAGNCYAVDVFDAPYIEGFDAPELDGARAADGRCPTARIAYRWAFDLVHVRLPGIGRAPLTIALQLARGRPDNQPVTSAVQINAAPLLALPLLPQPRTYYLLTPPLSTPSLDLSLRTPPTQPPGDVRALAFAADDLQVVALARPAPDWMQIGLLSLFVAASYLLLRRWAIPAPAAFALGGVIVALLLGLLVWERLGLTAFTRRMTALIVAGYGLTIGLEPLARGLARLCRLHPIPRHEARLIVALVALAWLLRTLGVLHPLAFSSDTGLHVNNLRNGVTIGKVIFTEGLPERAGGGQAPYPPGSYIMLAPFQLLRLDTATLLVVLNALADSLTILWLWLLLRALDVRFAVAAFAGALYVVATPLLRSLLTGELANVWGQALVLPWLLTLVLWRQGRAPALLLGATTAIVLLGHSGVFLSTLVFAAMLTLIWLVKREAAVWRWLLIGSAALLMVGVLYYSTFIDLIGQRRVVSSVTDTIAQRIGLELSKLTQPGGSIGPVLALLGLGGLALAWQRDGTLRDLLLAWWLGMIVSWGTLLISRQALRWEAFVFPALMIGGGLVLDRLWRVRTKPCWWARGAALAVLGVAIGQGGWLWIARLISYR